jgi:hypothetical protein
MGNDKRLDYLQVLHNICIKELTRQVSVTCVERGFLMNQVFEGYIQLFEKTTKSDMKNRNKLTNEFKAK